MFYIGDKNVLWTFQTIRDRDTFISSRAIWEDLFSSVGLWSIAITPQSRMEWVEFRGIPLHCWCDEFFMRLGWTVGEPLLIEEDTRNKVNLLRGRVLVLLPFNSKCPSAIKVVTGKRTFTVSVWEDAAQVSNSIVMRWLGLDRAGQGVVSSSGPERRKEKGHSGDVTTQVRREAVSKSVLSSSQKLSTERRYCQKSRDAETVMDVGEAIKQGVGGPIRVGGENTIWELKGKGALLRVNKPKNRLSFDRNRSVVLEKTRSVGWSSSSEESVERQYVNYPQCGGEHSKAGGRPNIRTPKGVKGSPDVKASKPGSKAPDETLSSSGNTLSHVSETQNQLLVGKENAQQGKTSFELGKSRKKEVKTAGTNKSHGMKTRKDKEKDLQDSRELECEMFSGPPSEIWNLEVEVAKVVEKGIALGLISGFKASIESEERYRRSAQRCEWQDHMLVSSSIGITDSISSEVIAIQRACNLINSKQTLADRNITIISDSKVTVSWVNGNGFGSLNLVNVVYDIRQTLHRLKCLSVIFMPRSSNSLADCLAKAGSGDSLRPRKADNPRKDIFARECAKEFWGALLAHRHPTWRRELFAIGP
ncbi:hypothetical protein Dsin_008758 [Dipteronia sinensis]|uniref:RNase H type-1 domain-containing protein n=1 Tax=Dipteronia sinensis TaxID=43782 RepID=A0AAE0APS8_9ROSI|nr:hypothetical protein Dsin_008758 [Dipteronia sinensis]